MELIESVPGSQGGSAVEGKQEGDQLALEDDNDIDEASGSGSLYHQTCLAAQEAIRLAQEQVSPTRS